MGSTGLGNDCETKDPNSERSLGTEAETQICLGGVRACVPRRIATILHN